MTPERDWIERRFAEVRVRIAAAPEWVRQAIAGDYSAKRQIRMTQEKRTDRWWKAGPFKDELGLDYWQIRRAPIGLTVVERVEDERIADQIVEAHARAVKGGAHP